MIIVPDLCGSEASEIEPKCSLHTVVITMETAVLSLFKPRKRYLCEISDLALSNDCD